MKSALCFAAALALAGLLPTAAGAGDSIFDVEHARAEYRAGRLTPENAELMDRYGWPSGCNGRPCYALQPPPEPVQIDLRRLDRRARW
ncbi:hypothetical protein [Hyphomicrobium sp.]|uniref:hypothetical protein n=1 Tax=Hyphomicrobium sp. TaxID=82 RepID=UPI002D7893A4|nr:hypothetical protein [Hyphomicrobium sp.]HET6389876.1 hypothetical protein [Hyphomicrobium sp.]